MAIGDIDNDGRIDAVVTTNGGAAHVLHNETATDEPLAYAASSSATQAIATASAR